MNNVLIWEALDSLRKNGMTKYVVKGCEGQVCARGALWEAQIGRELPIGAYIREPQPTGVPSYDLSEGSEEKALCAMAQELFPKRIFLNIVEFNNHPATTQEDLELVFMKTAIKGDEVL